VRREKLHVQTGSSLIELVVGTAIAVIVLAAVVGIQIAAYRMSRAGEVRFATQSEVALAMERIVQDVRRSLSMDAEGSSLTLEVETDSGEVRTVHYWLEAETGALMREEEGSARTLARGVVLLEFATTPEGAVAITIHGRLSDDQRYELTSLATPWSVR